MKLRIYPLAVLAILAVSVGQSNYPVVINEIMYNPSQALGPDYLFEWVELYNDSHDAVDMSGWMLTDDALTSTQTFDPGTVIEPAGYLVVARNDSAYAAHYGSSVELVGWTGSWSGLNNGGDYVFLYNPLDDVVDMVHYDDTASWGSDYGDENTTPDHDGDGPPLARIDPGGDSNDPANWESSIDEASGIPDDDWEGHDESHGTPGCWNETGMALETGTWAMIKAAF